jgi:phosphonate transport system permease protein
MSGEASRAQPVAPAQAGPRRFLVGRPWSAATALRAAALAAAAAALLWWTAGNLGFNWGELARGLPYIADVLGRMLPPNGSYLARLWQPLAETIQIALWGTVLGVVLALPLTFLAARNLAPAAWLFHATRQVLNALRGINEIIFALVFVAAVGLGPFSGVLALAIHGAGMLGKFFAEAIEEVDTGPVEAIRATGARPLQVIAFGVLPQAWPSWIAATLYRFEVNLRAATILGMVGAGGIGFELVSSLKLFQYQDASMCVLVILALVMITDWASSRLRARVLA